MLPTKQQVEISNKLECERSFYYFVKKAWSSVDSAQFQETWHIECLCVHMQALYDFKMPILDITIPPGHAKSLVCSVLFPVWVWLQDPSIRLLTGSHEMGLSIRDTLKSRYLIQSPWFQSLWGNRFLLTSDQNTKGNYLNDAKGYRIAISSGSGTTGYRGDIILFDDAMSRENANSEVERVRVNDYICQTLYNRQDILTKTRMCVIGQRLHHNDYHCIFLPLEGCVHVNLPLEYEPENSFSSPFYADPRTKSKEILWKIPKFQGKELERLKLMMGKDGFDTQYQQRPSVHEGAYLKRSDWRYYEQKDLPTNLRKISGWDFAAKTASQNDFTVCLKVGKCGSKFFIFDLYRKKVEYPQAKRDFIEHMEQFRPAKSYIEDASNGTPLISDLKTTKYFTSVIPVSTKGRDKLARVIPITPIVEAGNVYLPKDAPWLDTFIEECANFPNGDHDDIVDVLSMVLSQERRSMGNIVAYI